MNRRDFLTLLGRGALVAAVPIPALVNALGKRITDTRVFADFYDFDHQIGIGVEWFEDGERYRHVASLMTSDLEHVENISPMIADMMNEHIGTNVIASHEIDKALSRLKT